MGGFRGTLAPYRGSPYKLIERRGKKEVMRVKRAGLSMLLVAVALLLPTPSRAAELRVATWNVTNYSSGRVAVFQTAIYGTYEGRSLAPDVLVGQEFLSATGVTNFLAILNTAPGSPGDWAAADFVNGPDTDSAFFYRMGVVELATDLSPNGVTVVATGGYAPNHPRNIMRYDVRLSAGTSEEATVALYSSHMKAGSGSDDQARRLVEAERIRADAEVLPAGWHFVLGGDFNIQSSSQAAYQELIGAQVDNSGRFFDPIKTPGSWNNNSAYRIVHTQDPIGAGGMDDRHDQLLISAGLVDGAGLDYLGNPALAYSTTTWNDPNHTYRSWGNDGTSFNTTLTISGNQMVGSVIAQALTASAPGGGHLPVFLDLRVPPCLNDFECDGDVDLEDYAALTDCVSGPIGAPGFVPPSQGCLDYFDIDADEDVDMVDLAGFQAAFAN